MARAATVSSVQSGTTTSTATGTVTVTISSIDTTTSFLIFETRSSSNVPPGSYLRGRIASATTLEFTRVTTEATPATITITWYVASFSAGVKVQRGEVDQATTTINVSITAVAAVNQAFVTWSKTPGGGDTTMDGNDYILGELTSTSNLQFRTDGAYSGHTISWQVIEFTDAAHINVQKGSITTITGTTTSVTATLSPAVDVDRTFVLAGFRTSGTGAAIGVRMLRATLTSSTTVTIDRSVTGSVDVSRANAWTTGLTHTAGTGSNRLLIFVVGYEHSADPGVSTVTYGGQTLTRIAGSVGGTTTVARTELWYLNEAGIAAATDSTFSVTWGGTAPGLPMYAAATYKDVNQTTPVATSSTNSTNSSTPNPITTNVSVAGRTLALGAAISGNDGSYTWGGGWTEGTDQTAGTTVNMSSAENLASAAGTDTASATHTNPNRQAIVAAVLNPITDQDITEIVWQAVELKDGSTVQYGTASFTSGTAQQVVSLGRTVHTSRAIAFASGQVNGGQNLGTSPYVGDDLQGVGTFSMVLAPTQMTIDRTSTVDSADVGWIVVEFRPRNVRVCSREHRATRRTASRRGGSPPPAARAVAAWIAHMGSGQGRRVWRGARGGGAPTSDNAESVHFGRLCRLCPFSLRQLRQIHSGPHRDAGECHGQEAFCREPVFSTSSADLEALFSEMGTCESATVVSDRETGRSRGFGFVEMSSAGEAEKAISDLNGRDVGGRQINVSEAKAREGGSGGGRPRSGGFSGRRSY